MSDIIPENTPQKQCSKCKEWLPASLEFFSPREGRLASRCKACQRLWYRDAHPDAKWSKRLQDDVPQNHKRCVKCRGVKPIEQFNTLAKIKDGHRSRCKECYAVQNEKRKQRYIVERPPLPETKICRGCGVEQSLDAFPNEKSRKDGHGYFCIPCQNARNVLYRQEHKEQLTVYERIRSTIPERITSNHKSHQTHRVKRQAYRREYNRTHRHEFNERGMRRHAIKKKTQVEPVSYNRILDRDDYFCYICEKDINPVLKYPHQGSLTFDHQVPLTPRPGEPQGTHTEDNIHPAHRVCNVRKKNIPFENLTPFLRRGIS